MKGIRIKTYPHFDAPLSKAAAEELVAVPDLVSRHPFYPFLQRVQGWSKFAPKGVRPNEKRRKIRYAARRDSYIYSHYRQLLYPLYESELRRLALEECVLAYRHIPLPGRKSGKCNIHFASEAFQVIRRLGDCCAIALDIEEFFENLDHGHIKRTWSRLLGQSDPGSRYPLPMDHFAVFKAVTQYSWIERDLAYKELGLIGETQAAGEQKRIKYLVSKQVFPTQICTPPVFRQKLGDKVKSNSNPWGIPQGSPISDLLANLYMIDFDAKLSEAVRSIGGVYFRYSDDILIILPGPDALWDEMLHLVDTSLGSTAPRLRVKVKKTQVYSYTKLSGGPDQIAKNIGPTSGADGLEYLGFRYDGKRIFLRNSTFSGFRRKIAEVSQRMAKNHVLFNPKLNMKELVDSFNHNVLFKKFGRVGDFDFPGSEYTEWTFWTYIQRSVRILGTASSPILRQVNGYKSFVRGRVKSAIQDAYNRTRRP
jgi:hypothetical protein